VNNVDRSRWAHGSKKGRMRKEDECVGGKDKENLKLEALEA